MNSNEAPLITPEPLSTVATPSPRRKSHWIVFGLTILISFAPFLVGLALAGSTIYGAFRYPENIPLWAGFTAAFFMLFLLLPIATLVVGIKDGDMGTLLMNLLYGVFLWPGVLFMILLLAVIAPENDGSSNCKLDTSFHGVGSYSNCIP